MKKEYSLSECCQFSGALWNKNYYRNYYNQERIGKLVVKRKFHVTMDFPFLLGITPINIFKDITRDFVLTEKDVIEFKIPLNRELKSFEGVDIINFCVIFFRGTLYFIDRKKGILIDPYFYKKYSIVPSFKKWEGEYPLFLNPEYLYWVFGERSKRLCDILLCLQKTPIRIYPKEDNQLSFCKGGNTLITITEREFLSYFRKDKYPKYSNFLLNLYYKTSSLCKGEVI